MVIVSRAQGLGLRALRAAVLSAQPLALFVAFSLLTAPVHAQAVGGAEKRDRLPAIPGFRPWS